MARFLFAAWPFHGHLFPQIAVAVTLREQGHDCAFYTGNQAAAIVRGEGFTCFPFRHVNEATIDRLMRERPAEPWRLGSLPQMGLLLRRWLLDTIPDQVRDLEEIISASPPDVIASDPTMWGPMLVVHEKHRIPVATCSFIPACPIKGPDAPPFGPGLPRHPRGILSAVTAAVRASSWLSARLGRRAANRIRQAHGLPAIAMSAGEYPGQMPLYLVPTTAAFDYDRHDLPASVHYVGPYLWNRPRTEAATPWIAELPRDRPCVHVTEGTMHVHKPLVLPAAVTGLAGLHMQVIATTGGARTLADLGISEVAPNIRVERWVSHGELLPRTDLMVTTGGAGSVLASLAAGVPLVIVPTEWDKPEIAQRVVEAGAGVRLAPRDCTPARLRESVQRVLGDPSYKASAMRVAASFAEGGGAPRAAALLVALADGSLAGARG